MALTTGQPAPDFQLYDDGKRLVRLSEQRGTPVLLLFFPFAFSSVCTAELCGVRDNIAIYSALNVRVFGISVDSIYTLRRYREELKLGFSLLSDFNKATSRAYHTIYEEWKYDMKGVSRRSAFVIDEKGIMVYSEVLEEAEDVPDFVAIRSCLEKLR